jgi:hypothetical protein
MVVVCQSGTTIGEALQEYRAAIQSGGSYSKILYVSISLTLTDGSGTTKLYSPADSTFWTTADGPYTVFVTNQTDYYWKATQDQTWTASGTITLNASDGTEVNPQG